MIHIKPQAPKARGYCCRCLIRIQVRNKEQSLSPEPRLNGECWDTVTLWQNFEKQINKIAKVMWRKFKIILSPLSILFPPCWIQVNWDNFFSFNYIKHMHFLSQNAHNLLKQGAYISQAISITDLVLSQTSQMNVVTWWRHQMEAFSALPAICAGNSPVPG